MPHSFDNGPVPQRTLLQNGVVALLAPLVKKNGGYLADVIKYAGVVYSTQTEGPDINELKATFSRSPMIGVAVGTRPFTTLTVDKKTVSGPCELILYFANQHSRDRQRGQHESDAVALADVNADPGLHVMMQHALELLIGQYPTVSTSYLKAIEPKLEEEVITIQGMSLWRQTYHVLFTNTIPARGGQFRTPQELLTDIGWRVTTGVAEVLPPAPQTDPTSVDANTKDLEP